MISYEPQKNHASCDKINYTCASTFEKGNTLRFEILFGDWDKKVCKGDNDDVKSAVDYYFLPNRIFGLACHSVDDEFQNFHYAFILRACAPSEIGNIITGIVPGAEVLVATSTSVATSKLISLLKTLKKENVEPSQISLNHYRKLNYLLETKLNIDYFIGELIREKNPV